MPRQSPHSGAPSPQKKTECGKLAPICFLLWSVMAHPLDLNQLAQHIKQWGQSLGFQQVGICDTDLSAEEPRLQARLDKQYHGEMARMARHGMLRARPHELLPGTLRVISVRMNYLPAKAAFASTLKKIQNWDMSAVMH